MSKFRLCMAVIALLLLAAVPAGAAPTTATWYGADHAGLPTASGEPFAPADHTAAHPWHEFGTILEVENLNTGDTTRARVNDRGPYSGAGVDLSEAAMADIGGIEAGVVPVDVRVVI